MNPLLKCQVRLTAEQRGDLEQRARDGKTPARKARYAKLLLHADEAHPEGHRNDAWIGEALGMHVNTVARGRKLFAAGGLDAAFGRKPRQTPPVPPRSTAGSRPTCSPSTVARPQRGGPVGRSSSWTVS
jgi:hypothetical protein